MTSIDLSTVEHHPAIEEIAELLSNRTQNGDKKYFRVMTAFFLAKMAASMRANVVTKDRGTIPVNVYAIALAPSGFGKGHSVNILEQELVVGFRKRFEEDTYPLKADEWLWKLAIERAAGSGLTEQEEKDKLDREFFDKGPLPFTFDSGTPEGVKQIRDKLLLSNCGAINLQVDEIGLNLINAKDILPVFLELYDQGMTNFKLTKNTQDNKRSQQIVGKTPTNAYLMGAPVALLDGGKNESDFLAFLATGYARRGLFAWGERQSQGADLTPAEIYYRKIQPQSAALVSRWAQLFSNLADPTKYGWNAEVPDDVAIALLTYQMECERLSDAFPEHAEIRRSEMRHRYFKALKLAGTFAFVDEALTMTLDHLHQAIKLVEEGGDAFERMLTREKPHVRLARFIASHDDALTHADIKEALPFYPESGSKRNDMLQLAMGWGHKNCIAIRKSFVNGIELYEGEALKKTDLTDMIFSYSTHVAYNYEVNEGPVPFAKLDVLATLPAMHWCNHAFEDGHRLTEKAIPDFNMVVVDVDGGISLETVHEMLKDRVFMTYTTKRHRQVDPKTGQNYGDRFRLILPLDYTLKLDKADYREFMVNVIDWLPFKVDDDATKDIVKKWLTNEDAEVHMNLEGDLLDSMKFIPRTSPNEHYRGQMQSLESLDNLERWFAQRIAPGNRNDQLAQFAFALVDTGMNYFEVEETVLAFNKKLNNPLSVDELKNTVLVTTARKIAAKAA